jgi:hypothetical protein
MAARFNEMKPAMAPCCRVGRQSSLITLLMAASGFLFG